MYRPSKRPSHALTTAWLCVGRRGGKSNILALIAVFLACFKDWRPYLAPGEVGTIMIVAQDRKQARVIMRFIKGLLHASPMLEALIKSEREETVTLSSRIVIEVHSCSYRSVRGYSIVCALLDEIAVWRSEEDAANPAHEVLTAIKPALGTIPGSMLLCASSPQFRKGELWEAYRRHYGKDGDPTLVWHAATRTMNPSFSQDIVDAALEEDPARNRAEFLAEWRSDQEGFVTREAIEACVDFGIRERPPERGIRYNGFCDLSGGGADSMTLAISHFDKGCAVLDCLREVRSGASPSAVVEEFSAVLKSYWLTSVRGDNYAKEWPRELFAGHGIKYEPAGKFKNDIYLSTLPLINSGKCRLLDHTKTINQFLDLDRVVARGGRGLLTIPRVATTICAMPPAVPCSGRQPSARRW